MRAACGIVQPLSKRRLAPASKVLEAEAVNAKQLAEPREPGADHVGGEREEQRARSGQGPRGCGQTKANRSLFAQAHLGSGCTKLPPLNEGGSAACLDRIAPLRHGPPRDLHASRNDTRSGCHAGRCGGARGVSEGKLTPAEGAQVMALIEPMGRP